MSNQASSLSSYYPSGQRKLRKQGLDYNFENYINTFGNQIKNEDLEIIRGTNVPIIRENFRNNARRQSFLTILYYLLLIPLVASGYQIYSLFSSLVKIENGTIIVNNIWSIIISIVIFIILFLTTWKVKTEEIISKKTAEAGNLRLRE